MGVDHVIFYYAAPVPVSCLANAFSAWRLETLSVGGGVSDLVIRIAFAAGGLSEYDYLRLKSLAVCDPGGCAIVGLSSDGCLCVRSSSIALLYAVVSYHSRRLKD